MKTRFLLMAAMGTMLLTACTQEELTGDEAQRPSAAEELLPIGFDTYLSNSSTSKTRAGEETPPPYTSGLFKAENLKNDGFGIFAFRHTGAELPASAKPDFMYNQRVTYATEGGWTYSPLKYWPNQTTDDRRTGNDATSETTEHLSFFAYAPYQAAASLTGKVYGITAITGAEGAPTVTYKMNPQASESEDLLWGTAPMGGINYQAVNGTAINKAYGTPLTGMIKPDTHTRMKFLFQHALAAMAMDIQLAVDRVSAGQSGATGGNDFGDGQTKVFVDNIILTPKDASFGFATEGVLSLSNTRVNIPEWTSTTKVPLVVAASGGNVVLPESLQAGEGHAGVLAQTATPVFGTAACPLMFIPVFTEEAHQTVTVKITYRVVTTDSENTANSSTIVNTISKDVVLKSFRSGRLYNLHLVLGLTRVTVEAEALDWTVEEKTIDLPRNLD